MIIQCPKCGQIVEVNDLGRKAFNMPVINICDTLRACHSIASSARRLGCSRAYIYKVLKAKGLKPKDVLNQEEHEKGVA